MIKRRNLIFGLGVAAAQSARGWPEPLAFWATYAAAADPRTGALGEAVSHAGWQAVLDRYLVPSASGVTRFDYAALRGAGRADLQRYIDSLAATDPRQLGQAAAMAYWINLYNALTVAVVADDWPVTSIKRVRSRWLGRGPWDDELVAVAGQRLSLNDIEHGILRPVFRDNRIHYAVNCASLGCPNLAAKAYTGQGIGQQLDAAAGNFINHPRAVALDAAGLRLSSIYKWYADDFGSDERALFEHLAGFADAGLAARLRAYRGPVRYAYDWAVNAPEAE